MSKKAFAVELTIMAESQEEANKLIKGILLEKINDEIISFDPNDTHSVTLLEDADEVEKYYNLQQQQSDKSPTEREAVVWLENGCVQNIFLFGSDKKEAEDYALELGKKLGIATSDMTYDDFLNAQEENGGNIGGIEIFSAYARETNGYTYSNSKDSKIEAKEGDSFNLNSSRGYFGFKKADEMNKIASPSMRH